MQPLDLSRNPLSPKEFDQNTWNAAVREDFRELLRMAVREDLGSLGDCTTQALVPTTASGAAAVVARREGRVAGLQAAELILAEIDPRLTWTARKGDGDAVQPAETLATIVGPAASLLTAERLLLNLLGRLCGIATLTGKYVDAVAGTRARIYDTRKTTPGWRRLEKYAVRCGGGWNHRTGLFDAVLIKDNHLAFGAENATDAGCRYTPAEAVGRARAWIQERVPEPARHRMIVEIEVDTLQQFEEALPARPDAVLLDNMPPAMLRLAVARRDAAYPAVQLEASGGIDLPTVRAVAETGVDRISVGALTHSAIALDLGLDWLPA